MGDSPTSTGNTQDGVCAQWHNLSQCPLLTAGPHHLVHLGQCVQAYLENEVCKEEDDADPQESFKEAAGVTCETWATRHPS